MTLSNIRNTLKQLRIDREGIAALVVYSRVNDVFIGDATVYETPHFCETFFSGKGFGQERLFEILETLKGLCHD